MRATITDDIVAHLYSPPDLFIFPHGEEHKTRETKAMLEDQLLEAGFHRKGTLVGMGGGVVTDMAGFIAATFMRGVELVLIPTTLLAMVDASIGGKNGVNTSHGKNLIGSFYEPAEVVVDLNYLKTLPEIEMQQGIAEMIKHGFVAGDDYMSQGVTERTIRRSIEIKQEFVKGDRNDWGRRQQLNFGHTIGHALEKVSHYAIRHGFAVAMGMAAESFIAKELGLIAPSAFYRLIETLESFHLPTKIPHLPLKEILLALKMDKKGKFSLIETPVPETLIERALCWQQ